MHYQRMMGCLRTWPPVALDLASFAISSLRIYLLPSLLLFSTFLHRKIQISNSHLELSIMQTSRFLPRASALLPKQTTKSISRTFASSSIAMQRISDLIKHDHDELRTYKDNILKATDDDEKVRWQNQFTWELARHSIAEELVVYPAMEKNW
jgi:hypothetical protein